MGKTRDLFKRIRAVKGKFDAKMGSRALLGLTQGWQGSESAKSTHRAGRRSCSGKVAATRKLQVDVSEED